MLTRRKLLTSSAAGAAALKFSNKGEAWFAYGAPVAPTGVTIFAPCILGGGGFVDDISFSNDGTVAAIRTDVTGAYVMQNGGLWTQTINDTSIPAADQVGPYNSKGIGSGAGVYELRVAPSNGQRLYMIYPVVTNGPSYLYRSDNAGGTWTKASTQPFAADYGPARSFGSKGVVDPNNPDVFYVGDECGIIYRTLDAGATFAPVAGLLPALSTATARADVAAGGTTVHIDSTPTALNYAGVAGFPGNKTACLVYDATNPSSLGTKVAFVNYNKAWATSCTISNTTLTLGGTVGGTWAIGQTVIGVNGGITPGTIITGGSGTSWTVNNSQTVSTPEAMLAGIANQFNVSSFSITGTGVKNGDQLYFGNAPSIAFDPTSGTTMLNGVTVTKTIYFGWGFGGVSGMWATTNGGATFASIGGPATCGRCAVSQDNTLYMVEYAEYTVKPGRSNNLWRYNAPGESNTWTHLSASINGTWWVCVAPDPFTNGNVIIAAEAGGSPWLSTNHGTSFSPTRITHANRNATDAPWLATTLENYMSCSNMMFDPVIKGKLWFTEGIGVWIGFPYSGSNHVWTSHTLNNNELISTDITKPPGGGILLTVEDRSLVYMQNPTTGPSVNATPLVPISHGWSVCYAKADPLTCYAVFGNSVWKSTDGGQNWAIVPHQPSSGYGGTMAASAADNAVYFAALGNPKYTTDGGHTWNTCSFPDIAPDNTHWVGIYSSFNHIVDADASGNFYAFQQAGAYFWYSNDGGANWRKGARATHLINNFGYQQRLLQIPGFSGHLIFSSGAAGAHFPGGAIWPIVRSADGGQTINTTSANFWNAWAIGIGKAAPSNPDGYPAIYAVGWLTNRNANMGVYRCDNARIDITQPLTWTLLSPNSSGGSDIGSLDMPVVICGDPDVYGQVFLGMSSTGYIYGHL